MLASLFCYIVRSVISVVLAPAALYTFFLAISAVPFIQRHLVYLHKVHTLWWNDVDEPEKWGFAKNQVVAFSLKTSDGHSLYVWHILPLPLYLQHEQSLITRVESAAKDITKTINFKLLREDPDARLIINFHGNAGHVVQGWRPETYHAMTDTSSYHVITFDYRGFGHSSGSPTESGLIIDGRTVIDWALNVAKVPASHIVLVGQSLGTAVVCGVAEHHASQGVNFAAIILVAGFSHLPMMLSRYAVGGILPVLAPLRLFPPALQLIRRCVVDKWNSAERLAAVVRTTKRRLRIFIIHAKGDLDIPCEESNLLFKAAVRATISGKQLESDAEFDKAKAKVTKVQGCHSFVATWQEAPDMVIRQEQSTYGGHNSIMTMAPVALAIMRGFDLGGTAYDHQEDSPITESYDEKLL